MLLTLPVAIYLQCFTESVFVLNPLIDTQLPKGFTQAGFDSIQTGMTKTEVLKRIPAPAQGLETNSWGYGNDGAAAWGDYAWFSFQVDFDKSGKVTQTSQMKFHD
ncbi:hypothetical protein JOY44_17950 [Phormidium sp. CLA17]|uniref:hypothetical protein n=1 Tax=Leptolyngbya sp. Cla-17 TaxID=2803751 RepID=UPI001931A05D|nr:hypothetical protein [Leptolyngbya sp. Cla-17]MBM0743471.1 hypothetical protein [Leptolyngbya sp. Cla-17]